ncbi:sensor histidine kinase [Glycomyces albus]
MDTATDSAARPSPWPLIVVEALWSRRTWRELTHLVSGAVVGLIGGFALLCLVVATILGAPTVIVSLVAGALALSLCGSLTALQRSRHRAFLGLDLPAGRPYAAFSIRPRVLLELIGSGKTWARLGYHLISLSWGLMAAAIAVGTWAFAAALMFVPLYLMRVDLVVNPFALSALGVALLLFAPWTTRGLAALDAQMARQMLGVTRSEELEMRITDLAASRDSTVDAADAERRRIERDLHDGAQQRITALAVNLGIARATLTDLPEPGTRALAEAHEEAKQALGDLRDLVRGLHPAVLEDRGLDPALSAVAARSPVPVRVRVDMDRRVDRDIEAVAYFVVSEALTNVARHSGAEHASVEVVLRDLALHLTVSDDGAGGADPAAGTGLRGLADRVRSVDGTFSLTSPVGGPTTIEAELPCAWS